MNERGAISGSEINEVHIKAIMEHNKKVCLEWAFDILKHYGVIPEDTKLVIKEIE